MTQQARFQAKQCSDCSYDIVMMENCICEKTNWAENWKGYNIFSAENSSFDLLCKICKKKINTCKQKNQKIAVSSALKSTSCKKNN